MKRYVTEPGCGGCRRTGLAVVLAASLLACAEESSPGGTGGTGGTTATGGTGGSRGGTGGASGGSGGAAGSTGGTGGSAADAASTGGAGGAGGAAGSAGGTGGTGGGTGGATGGTGGGGAGGSSPADASGPAAPVERFVGRWNYTSGETRLECPGAQPLTQPNDGLFITFQAGAGVAPLILASPGCNLRFDIQGQTAVVQPGQSCTNAVGGRTATTRPTRFTFTLEEQVARQDAAWMVVFNATPDTPCTLTAAGVLAKP